jgi:hypothetical protein
VLAGWWSTRNREIISFFLKKLIFKINILKYLEILISNKKISNFFKTLLKYKKIKIKATFVY